MNGDYHGFSTVNYPGMFAEFAPEVRHVNGVSEEGPASALLDLIARLRPAWHAHAACHGLTGLFYPEAGSSATAATAKQVCAGCPVRVECGDAGNRESHGIWGGMGEKERRKVRRPRQPAPCGTTAGYSRHRTAGERPCDECAAAERRRRQATRIRRTAA